MYNLLSFVDMRGGLSRMVGERAKAVLCYSLTLNDE